MGLVILICVVFLIFGIIVMKNLANFVIKAVLIAAVLIGGLVALKSIGAFEDETPGQKLDQFIDLIDIP